MLSPFAGISLITHLCICFLYKTTRFFRGLFFGFKKNKNTELLVLVRAKNERFLPAMAIGTVFSIITGIAFFSLETSYRSTPNTFDLIASAAGSFQVFGKTREEPPSGGTQPFANETAPRRDAAAITALGDFSSRSRM